MTFGETVVNVATIIEVSSTVGFVAYTVPTGRYSIVSIKEATVGTTASSNIKVGGVEITDATSTTLVTPKDNLIVYLRSGQTITLDRGTSGSASINATAFEFNLP